MKILILGGHGFIGSHTANILKSQGHTIGVVDCYHQYYIFPDQEYQSVLRQRQEHCNADSVYSGKIEDPEFMENVFRQFRPDIVIHVATYPNAYMVKRNVIDATGNMITATAILLDLCVEYNVQRIVFASSSMVYGDFDAIGSGPPDETAPCNPMTLYGSYKLQGEKMVRIWNKEKGLEYSILRPSALYGTRDMIVRVVSKLAQSAIKNGNMIVQGPDNKLDFSWVEDVGRAFATCATDPACANEVFNCTKGNGRRIIEAAELVQQRLGGEIIAKPHDAFYPNRDTLNSNKLRELTAWNPSVDIEEGIPRYLDWFLSQDYLDSI